MRTLILAGLSLALIAASGAPAAAQSADEQSAYVALYYTPVAGLPPLAPALDTATKNRTSGVSLQGRIGQMSRRGGLSMTTMGFGVELPVGHWSLGGTIAYLSASCGPLWEGDSDCDGDMMVGASVRRTLTAKPLNDSYASVKGKRPARGAHDQTLLIGFDGSAGYSPRQGEQAVALSAGVPVALALRNGDLRIVPFITPGIGYGRLGSVQYFDDEYAMAHGTFAPMVGGGVGLQFGKSGVGATLGFQKVFKSDGGTTQLGVGMTWQGTTSR